MSAGIKGWNQLSRFPLTQLLEQTLASCHDAVLIVARESREILACNKAFEDIFGYPGDQACGRTTEFLYPDRGTFLDMGALGRITMEQGETVELDCQMRTADGRLIPTHHAASPITDDAGHIIAAVSVIQDRSPWQAAEQEIAETRELLATVFGNLPGAICRLELRGPHTPIVTAFEGALATNLVGEDAQRPHESFIDCLDVNDRHELNQALLHTAESGRPLDLPLRAKSIEDGTAYWLRLLAHPPKHRGDQVRWDALVLDISREKAADEHMRHLASHDSLTGLPNRALFQQIVDAKLKAPQQGDGPLGLIALNLDRFKYINNALGIAAGDQLLVEVAHRLQNLLGPMGTVARTGSDEFVILVTQTTAAEGMQPLLRRISHQMRTSFVLGQEVVHLSCCMGVALFPTHAADAEGLIVGADTALQRARSKGPGSYAYYESRMTDFIVATATLESDLHHAIQHRLLEIHYQPKVDPATFEVLGLEGLARWQHPHRGAISPAEFIPLAEETGLIHDIGEQVLYTACAQLMEWRSEGIFNGPISINLSGKQLTEAAGHQVQSILRETGLPAHCLELEITESALITDTEKAKRTLDHLTHAGVSIALDDFGKGYSSLSYLRRLPINTLKVDRSFVHLVEDNPNQSQLVATIVAMARSLQMHVVAEGVETKAQLKALKRHRVDAIQGWYFSPALAPEAITPLLTAGAVRPTGTYRYF